MAFASEKLYKGYLRRNMPTIVSTVKVREIIPYLPCLTDHDRENIEAKRETYGNYDSMVLLLDCLKRRENWPEEFITALEACDHPTIADEIRREYNSLRRTNNSNPSSPSATVIRAHVHPAPSASHVSILESDGRNQAAVTPPAEASAPPEPTSEASSPLEIPAQPEAPHSSAAMAPEDASPPEPVTEPLQSVQIEVVPAPSTPPPSPETPYTQGARTSPPPQKETRSHQEPVEDSESDIQVIPGDNEFIPDQVSAGNGEVNSVNTPHPSDPVEQCGTEALSQREALQTTNSTEVRPPQSASPTHINANVMTGSSSHMMTPEKSPVQDTTPPVEFKPAAVLQPEETSEPPATQVVGSSPQTETAASASVLPGAARTDTSPFDNTVCLSKPGDLISILPQNHGSPANPAPGSPVEPYSGTSERLEISGAAVTSAHVPACSTVSSTNVNTTSALPCQENGIDLKPNEPEENHYESPCQSLETQEVRVNVVQVSEEPSILNLDGQSSAPQAQMINGEAAKEIISEPPLSTSVNAVPSVNTPSGENYQPLEAAPADISPELKTLQEEKTSSCMLTTNTKYFLTAAGVGAFALLMAWKLKN